MLLHLRAGGASDIHIEPGANGVLVRIRIDGALQELLKVVDEGGVNIEYMYGLSIESEEAYVVLKASDCVKIEEILKEKAPEVIEGEALNLLIGSIPLEGCEKEAIEENILKVLKNNLEKPKFEAANPHKSNT